MIINSMNHETVKSGSMMSNQNIMEGQDDCETVEQRLRLLGDMPSSSSGGTQGRLKQAHAGSQVWREALRGGDHHEYGVDRRNG